jgi:repressor LexA
MSRPPLSSLSAAQRRVLHAVLRREAQRKPNFISDLLQELGLKTQSSLGPTLQRMERLGVLEIQGGGARGRQRLVVSTTKGRLLAAADPGADSRGGHGALSGALSGASTPDHPAFWGGATPYPYLRQLPVLGAIPAGPLEEVMAQGEVEWVGADAVLRSQPGDFLLRIKGDSMCGDGILEGDLVLLRPGIEAHTGEIVAALATGAGGDCDATLKHIFWRNEGKQVAPSQGREVVLRASNPAYADLVLPAESVRIAGVFRGLVRQSPRV